MGDEQIILSSGMLVNKTPEPVGPLPAPQNLRLTSGINQGEIIADFNKVQNAASYYIEYYEPLDIETQEAINDIILGKNLSNLPWQRPEATTKSKITIKNLIPGNRIIVRVAALNSDGLGTWSDPATIIVP